MGNILFLSGLGLTIGLKSTMQFFTKPKNYKVILQPLYLLGLLPLNMSNIPSFSITALVNRVLSHLVLVFFWFSLGGRFLACS
ncbi:Got1/Sft2-like vescicle transport protein family [Zea mays]|uniref:Got1/Sft2-like vescicle transport protein family n=1 Tax=Zea mays TaxID=4577 RepID=A0A1D6JRJ2_MAIZE|nr:Got1/Sft2-like vescicle transport protein family [Zea mays]